MAKILVVEDDTSIAAIYEKVFRLAGHESEIALNGEEALNKLKAMRKKPTAILLDMVMPKLNGREVVEKIKLDKDYEDFKNIPIVIITNLPRLTGAEDIKKALELGAVECLLKSMYDPSAVVEKVEEIITKSNKPR